MLTVVKLHLNPDNSLDWTVPLIFINFGRGQLEHNCGGHLGGGGGGFSQ